MITEHTLDPYFMPETDGKLTLEDREKIRQVFERYKGATDSKCPICGSDIWILGEHVVMPVSSGANNTIFFGGPVYPQVMLVSKECGYTRFFNAVLLGIVDPKLSEQKTPVKSETENVDS